jgi:hypothetical protein
MSESAAIKTRGDVLPGFVLSTPTIFAEYDIAEEMHRRLVATLVAGAVRVDANLFDRAMEKAESLVKLKPFAARTKQYDEAILRDESLTPFLAWSCARRNHAAVTLPTIEKLITDENFYTVRVAVLDLFGFQPKNDGGEPAPQTAPAASTSTPSPESSASEGSPGPKSD